MITGRPTASTTFLFHAKAGVEQKKDMGFDWSTALIASFRRPSLCNDVWFWDHDVDGHRNREESVITSLAQGPGFRFALKCLREDQRHQLLFFSKRRLVSNETDRGFDGKTNRCLFCFSKGFIAADDVQNKSSRNPGENHWTHALVFGPDQQTD